MLDGISAKASMLIATANNSQVAHALTQASGAPAIPWWVWPLLLLVTSFVLGIFAVLSGVGGSVLYTPIISSFFPFHMDFVRGAGLFVALSGALSAGPGLLKNNLANLRLVVPLALIASIFSTIGAFVGLALPSNILQLSLGIIVILISILFVFAKNSDFPQVGKRDTLASALKIGGIYYEPAVNRPVDWTVWRTPQGFLLFIVIGLIAGMFGLGAGWANVPTLNMLMGAPLKIAVGSSKFLLSITDTSAAWVYLNQGAVLPVLVVPSVLGIMMGSQVGVKLLARSKPKIIRNIVIIMLLLTGITSLFKAFNISF